MRDREDEVEANVKYEISYKLMIPSTISAELAQSVERTTLNRVVEGSIPSFGDGSLVPTLTFLISTLLVFFGLTNLFFVAGSKFLLSFFALLLTYIPSS